MPVLKSGKYMMISFVSEHKKMRRAVSYCITIVVVACSVLFYNCATKVDKLHTTEETGPVAPDILPEYSTESILRFDQIQPIIRHHNAIKITKYCLSEESLIILSEWLEWLFEGTFATEEGT